MYWWANPLLFIYFITLWYFTFFLFPPIRRTLKPISKYENNVHFLVIMRQILAFFSPLAISTAFFGLGFASQQLTSLVVLGLSINVFWVIQLPLLTKAHILVTIEAKSVKDESLKKNQKEKFESKISLESGKTTLLRTAIYNLGFSTYKNAMVLIYFGEEFDIIPCDETGYNELDFSKKFTIQEKHGGVAFTPKDNFQSIPPQEVFIFPVLLRVPNIAKKGNFKIIFSSENSWGMKEILIPFEISGKPPDVHSFKAVKQN